MIFKRENSSDDLPGFHTNFAAERWKKNKTITACKLPAIDVRPATGSAFAKKV